MLGNVQSSDFLPHLHERFRIYLDPVDLEGDLTPSGESVEMELISVTELSRSSEDDDDDVPRTRRQPFSLIFREPSSTYLPQRIYLLEHEVLGRLPLFFVPIGTGQKGTRYQVVFT